ncbi:MAG: outer membrane protein [Pseudolabrys sp.]|jgi:outer membrane immunogenic protein
MTRVIRSVSLWFLALALTTPSFAADIARPIYKTPPPAPYFAPYSWTGLYVGLNGGYAWGKADVSNALGSFTTNSQHGWLLGGTLGYNLQNGVWVWGIEGDADYAFVKGNASNVATCGAGTCEVKNTWFASARGRIGYAIDRWMPFITGGAAFAGLKVSPSTGGSSTKNTTGWTIGGGFEYGFTPGWSAKLEYLYADLGKSTCDAGICGLSTDIKPKINMVRAGLNYHF